MSPLGLVRAMFSLSERLVPDLIAQHLSGLAAQSREGEFIRAPEARHVRPDSVVLNDEGHAVTMASVVAGCEL